MRGFYFWCMQVFYAKDILGSEVVLDADESRHMVKVLRKNEGDRLLVMDGKGSRFHCVLEDANPKAARLLIQSSAFEERKHTCTLYIAPTKNANRMEWLLEKAVELGVSSVHFMICEHSERSNLRLDRLEKIALAAMKQSMQPYLSSLHEAKSFEACLPELNPAHSFLAHCRENMPRKAIQDISFVQMKSTVLIGPEGDFSVKEIEKAQQLGIESVHLGQERLRTETAALYALSVLKSKREQ